MLREHSSEIIRRKFELRKISPQGRNYSALTFLDFSTSSQQRKLKMTRKTNQNLTNRIFVLTVAFGG